MSPPPGKILLTPEEFESLLQRLAQQSLTSEDYELLIQVVQAMGWMSAELEEKKLSIHRLQRLFGIKTESSRNLMKPDDSTTDKPGDPSKDPNESLDVPEDKKSKPKGHGRNGSEAYTGAKRVPVKLEGFHPGDPCPECPNGRLYDLTNPGIFIRVTGHPPIQATIYELQKMRCNLCGKIITAELPKEAGDKKYDETAQSMIAVLRYGAGFPTYRLSGFQMDQGIPLAESTQWDNIEHAADTCQHIYKELIRQAAQGELIHNDDTTMRILSEYTQETSPGEKKRTGIFTTGILSITGNQQISLYFTGHQHAGENLHDILTKRFSSSGKVIQMCDALSRNKPKEFEVILANCLTHARRYFADLIYIFPDTCLYVIKQLAAVYHHDEIAKTENMTSLERLAYHQQHSKPIMDDLNIWIQKQFEQKQVEPNSSLGKAFKYMLNHWEPLTQFLITPGCPLDNNAVERCLKKAVLHRKNSLFYKTEFGAYIGDIFMSIIQTCRLGKVNPFNYITAILTNKKNVFQHPDHWMPWNYQDNLINQIP